MLPKESFIETPAQQKCPIPGTIGTASMYLTALTCEVPGEVSRHSHRKQVTGWVLFSFSFKLMPLLKALTSRYQPLLSEPLTCPRVQEVCATEEMAGPRYDGNSSRLQKLSHDVTE